MSGLAAIIFDFDGVLADCQRGVLLDGVAPFVRAAAVRVPLGIASGAMSAEIEEILRAGDLLPAFAAIIGVDRAARTKP
jgi:phosphoglycolate phosphatase-like HAD superfamily hydrolase